MFEIKIVSLYYVDKFYKIVDIFTELNFFFTEIHALFFVFLFFVSQCYIDLILRSYYLIALLW